MLRKPMIQPPNSSTPGFKDLFSSQAVNYAKFRPTYPDQLFRYLASIVDQQTLAWDCGTGSGQAANQLGVYFDQVVATDPSSKQVSSALSDPLKNAKVDYQVGSAEQTQFLNQSVNLITAAQCFHWFRQEAFYEEASRVLTSKGVLAIWCYSLCRTTPELDRAILKLYHDVLGAYWEPERQLVDEGYQSVRLPFYEIKPPQFEMVATWSLDHLLGYLGTWSALRTFVEKEGQNPLDAKMNSEILREITLAWGDAATRKVQWPLTLRVGTKHPIL